MNQTNSTGKKSEPPAEIKEVARFLRNYCIGLSFAGIFALVLHFARNNSSDVSNLVASFFFFALAIFEGICSYAFYHLEPWSYSVVMNLLPLHGGATRLAAFSEDGEEAVRQAFGVKE